MNSIFMLMSFVHNTAYVFWKTQYATRWSG